MNNEHSENKESKKQKEIDLTLPMKSGFFFLPS